MDKFIAYFKKEFSVEFPGDITWAHGVNSRQKLKKFINNPETMIIECDIRVSSNGIPIAVHPPQLKSNLFFDELILQMKKSKKGLKLDFKDPEIVKECLKKLKKAKLLQPVILNADILQGNCPEVCKFNAFEFLDQCRKYYPEGILSLGWTVTDGSSIPYSQKNIEEMVDICSGLKDVTFPVRACLLPHSWKNLSSLIENKLWTFTVWNNEPISPSLSSWMRENLDFKKTFFDLIDEDKNPLRLWERTKGFRT